MEKYTNLISTFSNYIFTIFYNNYFINAKNIMYDNFQNIQPSSNKKLDVLAYSNSIGLRLLKTKDSTEHKKLKADIHKKKLYNYIFNYYNKSYFSIEYLYYLNTIVLLQEEESRKLYHEILNKDNHHITEFNILALHGLALISQTPNEVLKLHHFLTKSYDHYWISQKLATYFFIIALENLEDNKILDTLEFAPGNSYLTYALIYALRAIKPTQEMKVKLLQIQQRNKQDDVLLVAILRTFYAWKTYVPELILENYKHENVLMRIVCSKIGLDLIGRELSYKLLIYLVDESYYVRNNFMESLQKNQYAKDEIINKLKQHYPNYYKNKSLMQWLKYYRVGTLNA